MWWWIGLALAQPTVENVGTGRYEGTVPLAQTCDDLRPRIADPLFLLDIDPSGTQITTITPDAPCALVTYKAPTMFGHMRYTLRRCPVDTGYANALHSSPDFKVYASSWTLEPLEGGGCQTTYRLHIKPSMAVPDFLMRGSVKRSVHKLLASLEAWDATQTAQVK